MARQQFDKNAINCFAREGMSMSKEKVSEMEESLIYGKTKNEKENIEHSFTVE